MHLTQICDHMHVCSSAEQEYLWNSVGCDVTNLARVFVEKLKLLHLFDVFHYLKLLR